MLESPFQSPAGADLGDFSPGESAASRSPKLGILVWTVLILDSLGCSLHLYVGLQETIHTARNSLLSDASSFVMWAANVIGIGLFGLSGNILILLKRRVGIPLAMVSMFAEVVRNGYGIWSHSDAGRLFDYELDDYHLFMAGLLTQVAWLLFYGIVVWIAARRLKRTFGRDG